MNTVSIVYLLCSVGFSSRNFRSLMANCFVLFYCSLSRDQKSPKGPEIQEATSMASALVLVLDAQAPGQSVGPSVGWSGFPF